MNLRLCLECGLVPRWKGPVSMVELPLETMVLRVGSSSLFLPTTQSVQVRRGAWCPAGKTSETPGQEYCWNLSGLMSSLRKTSHHSHQQLHQEHRNEWNWFTWNREIQIIQEQVGVVCWNASWQGLGSHCPRLSGPLLVSGQSSSVPFKITLEKCQTTDLAPWLESAAL